MAIFHEQKINKKREAEKKKHKKNSSQVQGLNYVFIPILHDNFYFALLLTGA